MAKPKSAELALPPSRESISLGHRLLLAALARNGHPLRPYPAEVTQADLDAAIAPLRAAGLVHGPAWEPNLTLDGRDLARDLAAKQKTSAAA